MTTSLPAEVPLGKFKGQPIKSMRTAYLVWFISQDGLRTKYPLTALAMIAELRERFARSDQVEEELLPGLASALVAAADIC